MKIFLLLLSTLFWFALTNTYCQTPKKVNTFPEDYVGKTISFRDIKYWPLLVEYNGYYTVQIDVSNSSWENEVEREWGFKVLNQIIGVVGKDIAKQMINKDVGGYNHLYFGAVTGTVVKSDLIFGSHYMFIIPKIINYSPSDPNLIIDVFQKQKGK